MTEEQLKIVVGLIAGCEAALVTMADYLAKTTGLDKENLAQHFEATAVGLPQDIQQRHLFQMVLQQVAGGLRSSGGASAQDELRQVLH